MSTQPAETRICVYYSKPKLLFLSVIAILFIVEGIWLIDLSYLPGAFAPNSMRVIAAILICFFSVPLYVYGSKIFSNKPAYIIRPEGYTDNAGFVKHRFIPWDNVTDIHIYLQQITGFLSFRYNNKYVIVNIKDNENYLSHFGRLKKMWLNMKCRFYGTPLLLNTSGMNIKPQQLYRLLEQHVADYRHKKMQH